MTKLKKIVSIVLTIAMLCTALLSMVKIVHASMLPLKEETAYLILNKETDEQLKAMSISTVLGKLQDKDGNLVSLDGNETTVWYCVKDTNSGLESYEAYLIDGSDGKTLDLSQPTGVNMQTVEMIIGKGGQLNDENIRYTVKVYYTGYKNNITFELYSQSQDGTTRTKIEPLKKKYFKSTYDKIVDINGEPVPMVNTVYSLPEGYVTNPYLGIKCSIDDRPDVRVELYEITDTNLSNPITNDFLNQDMSKVNTGYRMTEEAAFFIMRFYIDGIDAGVQVCTFSIVGSFPYISSDLFEINSGFKESVVYSTTEDIDLDNDVVTLTHEVKNGKTSDNEYYLNLKATNGDTDLSGDVVKAVVGHYDSLAAAASATDIKSELFSTTSGYKTDCSSDGVDITVFFEDSVNDNIPYKLTIKTVDYASNIREFTEKPIIGEADPWLRVVGAADSSGNAYDTYVIENGKNINMDTYYGYGYQTVFINDANADLSSIKPEFWYANTERVYAVDENTGNRVGTDHIRDFSSENQQYAGIITDKSNKQNERNYWVTFKKLNNNGPELFVYGPSEREVILDEYFEFKHDILIANIGNAPLEDISVELLDAENVKLDPYWTVGGDGNDTLAAFTTTEKTTQYGELANMAKIRLLPDGDGEVKGTLIIRAKGQEPVMITLNGKAQNPKIVTESLDDAVKYVPYQHIIATNNIHDWINTKYAVVEGTLPEGVELNEETGELYGVPSVPEDNADEETYTFTIEATYTYNDENGKFDPAYASYNLFEPSRAELSITVKNNTDKNVYEASDKTESSDLNDGYSIKQHMGTQVDDYRFELDVTEEAVYISYGRYSEFVKLWLNGVLLEENVDYKSEAGSTKITIKSQTLENNTNPDSANTIAMEFRKDDNGDGKGDNGAKMNRTSQNYYIKQKTNVEKVIDQITLLPAADDINNSNLDDVKSDVQSVRNAYDKLSAEEQKKVTNRQKLFDAEQKLTDLNAANKVVEKINNIPANITTDAKDKIQNARVAYNALTSIQKKLVSNLDRLEKAEQALAKYEADIAAAQKVDNLIKNLPSPLTLKDEEKVNNARAAYNNLTADQKKYVTGGIALRTAENEIIRLKAEVREQAEINAVITAIDAIPEKLTISDRAIVEKARTAYNALTDSQKEKVVNIDDLIKAENTIKALEAQENASKVDKAAAQEVINLIDAIPEKISLTDKSVIETARTAYKQLTDKQKELVTNYGELIKAEAIIKSFKDYEAASKKDRTAADKVINLINAIPTDVTLNDKAGIEAARNAYNKLTDNQKKIITNYNVLADAEVRIAKLENDDYKEVQSVTLVGILVDKNGKALADKIVEIHSEIQNGRTDENGSFQFNNVEFGKHTIFIKDESGNITAQREFNIVIGTPLALNNNEIVAENGSVFTLRMQLDENELTFVNIEEGNKAPVVDINRNDGVDIDEGDNSNIILWYALLIASLSGLITTTFGMRRKRNE